MPVGRLLLVATLAVAALSQSIPAARAVADPPQAVLEYQCGTLRAAIEDLVATHGRRYPNGSGYLRRLDELVDTLKARAK